MAKKIPFEAMAKDRFIEGRNKKLSYTGEFKDFVRENPGVLKSILDLIAEADKKSDLEWVSAGGIEVERLCGYAGKRSGYFVKVGNGNFFLKKVCSSTEADYIARGFEEAVSTKKAKEIVKSMSGVRVINFQLGYQDNKNSYFVSAWEGLPRVVPLFKFLYGDKSFLRGTSGDSLTNEEFEIMLLRRRGNVADRVGKLMSLFNENGYFDVSPRNMLYDFNSDQIVLLDIFDERSLR